MIKRLIFIYVLFTLNILTAFPSIVNKGKSITPNLEIKLNTFYYYILLV